MLFKGLVLRFFFCIFFLYFTFKLLLLFHSYKDKDDVDVDFLWRFFFS